MMRGLGAVVYKELRQARRDPATLFLALLIPVVQLLIFGFAIDTEIRRIPTVVVDRAQVRASRDLEAALAATDVFRIEYRVPGRDEALSLLRSGRARVAVFVPEDLEASLLAGTTVPIQFLIDGSDSSLSLNAQMAALGTTLALSERFRSGPGPATLFEARPRLLYNPDGRSETFFVPGLAGIILRRGLEDDKVLGFVSLLFVGHVRPLRPFV